MSVCEMANWPIVGAPFFIAAAHVEARDALEESDLVVAVVRKAPPAKRCRAIGGGGKEQLSRTRLRASRAPSEELVAKREKSIP